MMRLEPTLVRQAVRDQAEQTVRHLSEAVRIPSETGREGLIAGFYRDLLAELGLEVSLQPVDPEQVGDAFAFWEQERDLADRPNVFGRWSVGAGRSLALNGHVDVVPPGERASWSDDPWSGTVRDGRVFGRGAADMKGGIASAIAAVAALRELGATPGWDIEVQCVVGEETGGVGSVAAACQGHVNDAVVVLEPTELALAPAQAGILKFTLEVVGRAAHTSMPWRGVSAFEKLVALYGPLQELADERSARNRHPLFEDWPNKAPFAVGLVQAGHHAWTIPDRATASGRFGVLPGEDLGEARAAFEARVAEVAQDDPWLVEHSPVVHWAHGAFAGWETDADHVLVRSLDRALALTGGAVRRGMLYGSDASHFVRLTGKPAVLFGPGTISDAHMPDESVAIEEVLRAAEVLALALVDHEEDA